MGELCLVCHFSSQLHQIFRPLPLNQLTSVNNACPTTTLLSTGGGETGRVQLDWLISQLEDETKRETVVLAQAGPRLEESIRPDVRKSN